MATAKFMDRRRVRLTLAREMLGTSTNNPNIYKDFFEEKARKGMEEKADARAACGNDVPQDVDERIDSEIASIESVPADEKGITVFPRLQDGTPFMWDYQLTGAFKEACSHLRRVPATRSSKLKAYKKVIDGNIFIGQEKVPIRIPEGLEMGYCQRPLRASTPQGERVALACSETVPVGSVLEFDIVCMDGAVWPTVEEWLTYFSLHGIGQWRNSGKGRCRWEYVEK